ncbi:hypothetical protein D9Q98_008682 [Chlorella vulgaris]|uniref:Proteasome assembly chaperone 1 n=1 Tax=Chlorella vulgaris TaxID=3077 RepID=A0A9D4TIG3_CHLVU|nr:hypothetical protein D9Q98_008682 [Chlorella vulgaris]
MVWLEDPLTADAPHRGIVEEEDEAMARELVPQYAITPQVQWTAAAVKQATVVFLVGPTACLLAGPFFQGTQALGSITMPELVRIKSPVEDEYGTSQQPVHTCSMHGPTTQTPPILLVTCPRELPQEQAAAWARFVLAELRPAAVAVACTLPAMSYCGPGSPADQDLVFSLQTAAAEGAAAAGSKLPRPLPESSLLGGLPAALLTECELQQLPAVLVTSVQMHQVADAQFLFGLGEAAMAALQRVGGDAAAAALVQQQPKPQRLAVLSAAADDVFRSSASSSIFS